MSLALHVSLNKSSMECRAMQVEQPPMVRLAEPHVRFIDSVHFVVATGGTNFCVMFSFPTCPLLHQMPKQSHM
eukprot:CAMPEP_0177543890 /NCGR_PEP_ID=MMETSP0369-20130122/61679_1 /TAXON_ID=447022 ORGANISM="Scrippsiella hangoei-like, Strain SHHI-4" /NCGR_SAMPLE_ID=MMETSP0369 /ASSEMBLY_ACC=CAM_ASM_000364 /LENGTH=72 /DNA_ID=CAMNT_0019027853 /DNA_START=79 /DNA_END=294 /DNA_ORIENTATION=+